MPDPNNPLSAAELVDAIMGDVAAGRDAELSIIQRAEPPVNLRTLFFNAQFGAREDWTDFGGTVIDLAGVIPLDQFIDRDITLCPAVRDYLASRKPDFPFSEGEVAGLESLMELHHGIEEPYYVHMSLALQQLGRAWQFEPDAAHFLTGFTLGKE